MPKVQLIAIIALAILLPAALVASQLQTNLNSRANVDSTPVTPVTPPDTATPVPETPTPTPTIAYAAEITEINSGFYAPPLIPDTVFTVEAWVNIEPFTQSQSLENRYIFMQGLPFPSQYEVSMHLSGHPSIFNGQAARLHATIYDGAGQPVTLLNSGPAVTVNEWHHIALSRDGNRLRAFVDGQLVALAGFSGTTSVAQAPGLSLGTRSNSLAHNIFFANSPINGLMDEIRISSIARYTQNFTPPLLPLPIDASTIALYALDGDGDDASGNGRHAQIKGPVNFVEDIAPTPTPLPTEVPTETPTPTAVPTETPSPTITSQPTATPSLTLTATPTPPGIACTTSLECAATEFCLNTRCAPVYCPVNPNPYSCTSWEIAFHRCAPRTKPPGTPCQTLNGIPGVCGFGRCIMNTPTPTVTPSPTPTPTVTPSPTPTDTPTPTLTPTPTVTPSPSPTPPLIRGTYPAIADAYVRRSSSRRSYGTGNRMEVDGNPQEISYLKFDLSSLAGKNVERARLRLRITNKSSHTQTVSRVDDTSWSENSLTYQNRPALGGAAARFRARRDGSWIEIDVTSWVKEKTGGLASMAINQTGSDGITFASRETNNKPRLVISYR